MRALLALAGEIFAVAIAMRHEHGAGFLAFLHHVDDGQLGAHDFGGGPTGFYHSTRPPRKKITQEQCHLQAFKDINRRSVLIALGFCIPGFLYGERSPVHKRTSIVTLDPHFVLEVRYGDELVQLRAADIILGLKAWQRLTSSTEVECPQTMGATYPLPCRRATDLGAAVGLEPRE